MSRSGVASPSPWLASPAKLIPRCRLRLPQSGAVRKLTDYRDDFMPTANRITGRDSYLYRLSPDPVEDYRACFAEYRYSTSIICRFVCVVQVCFCLTKTGGLIRTVDHLWHESRRYRSLVQAFGLRVFRMARADLPTDHAPAHTRYTATQEQCRQPALQAAQTPPTTTKYMKSPAAGFSRALRECLPHIFAALTLLPIQNTSNYYVQYLYRQHSSTGGICRLCH